MTQRKEFPSPATSVSLADEVAHPSRVLSGPLAWVGMRGIEMPVRWFGDGNVPVNLPAMVSAAVDLTDADARGIHMSRLYRLCDECFSAGALEVPGLSALTAAMLASHEGLSRRAMVKIGFQLPLRRPALLSGLSGWRQYPVTVTVHGDQDGACCELAVQVLYSSTCPGSAAMARQVVQARFSAQFGTGEVDGDAVARWLASPEGGAATPHAQRSRASVRVRLAANVARIPAVALIDDIERALATPVQGAVKRVDEQEFARLNGANPMYCEDAARRIGAALEPLPWVADYMIEAAHLESLHPHDAVAQAVKGVPGGFRATGF